MEQDKKTLDGQQNQDDLNQEEEETVSLSKAELEKLQTKAAALDDSTKEAQRYNHLEKFLKDNDYFVDLYEKTDRKAAEFIVERIGSLIWYSSAEELYKKLKGGKSESKSTQDPEEVVQKVLDQREADKAYQSFLSKKNLSENDEFFGDVKEVFDELMEGKSRNASNVEKNLKRAYNEAKWVSKFFEEWNETKGALAKTGGAWTSSATRTPSHGIKVPAKTKKGHVSFRDHFNKLAKKN